MLEILSLRYLLGDIQEYYITDNGKEFVNKILCWLFVLWLDFSLQVHPDPILQVELLPSPFRF